MIGNIVNWILLNILGIMSSLLVVLVGVAFLTLLERKILSGLQFRKGPNKVGLVGMFQPFSDAIKLFSNELFIIYKSNYIIYYLCPLVMFLMMMLLWLILPFFTNVYYMNYSMLVMIILMSLFSYILLFMGWSSNSVYSMMGSLRSVVQVLSYEVSFILILMVFMVLSETCALDDLKEWQVYMWNFWFLLPLFLIFFISILAELNRGPLDFIEGESELVSGFNIEYFSGGFALVFLSEYGKIIFFSFVMVLLFFKVGDFSFCLFIYLNGIIWMIINVRGFLSRLRYDYLMGLCWKIFLPLILGLLMFFMGYKILVIIILLF